MATVNSELALPDFEVRAGQTMILYEPPQGIYNQFIMNHNSSIRCYCKFVISAQRAIFGNSCVIDGSGGDGEDAPDQSYVPPQAGQLNSGYHGQPGGSGLHGINGYDITLNVGLTLQDAGSLTIVSNGGNGGHGGRGGIGGKGGGATCLGGNGYAGGNGGDGGPGGVGGDSGQIIFRWTPVGFAIGEDNDGPFDGFGVPGRPLLMPILPPQANLAVTFIANGGHPGRPGELGQGGPGGDGVDCLGYSRGGGGQGGDGHRGGPGRSGTSKAPIYIMV